MSDEKLYSRLSAMQGQEPRWFIKFEDRAWARPMTDMFVNPNTEKFWVYPGEMGATGFIQTQPRAEACLLVGMVAGVFFAGEVTGAIRWPFRNQPYGHEYRWLAYGLGQTKAWTEQSNAGGANGWRIDDGNSISGGVYPPHFISEFGSDTADQQGATFPGMPGPLSRDGGDISRSKMTLWKWLALEGKFCPILQPNSA